MIKPEVELLIEREMLVVVVEDLVEIDPEVLEEGKF